MESVSRDYAASLKRGDASVMSALYDEYSSSLYGVVLRILRSTSHAEDVLQETFVRVWTNRESYTSDRGTLFTWMLNIARNLAIDTLRKASFSREEIQSAEEIVGIESRVSDPREAAESVDLRSLVGTLPKEQEEIIDLVYFKGYSQSEIAKEFDIPLGTVKSRVRLAMNTLRSIYGVSL
ncbi:MAG: sigma-70 family RNA polymerase sigma factor [Candidatus Kapabacteria bacterium]|nr:sigma-70 family RNA polymerase sigma factor [Candidatus Kapabacteria bacterium]